MSQIRKMQFRILFILLFYAAFGFSQQVAVTELLQEAESRFWDFPEHSIRIAEYVLSQHEKNEVAARANLILARSYFVQDRIYESVKAGFEAQQLAGETASISVRIEAKLTNLQILRELLLTSLADELKEDIIQLNKKDANSLKTENRLNLIEAEWALNNEEPAVAEKFYALIDPAFIVSDSIQNLRFQLGNARLLFKQFKTDEALAILNQLPPQIPKYFRIIKLNLMGEIYFRNKDLEQSVSIWNEAKTLAEELPNKELTNQSLEGLIQVYLIQEDSKKYLDYKRESNSVISELITNRVRAVNFTYNYFENIQEQKATETLIFARNKIYLVSAIIIFFISLFLGFRFYYRLRIKEYLVFKKLISPPSPPPKKELPEKTFIPEETENQLLRALKNFESGIDYTRSDMSIAFLAARLNTNTKYLSEVINRNKQKNFNGYINELRINYIIQKLKTDPIYLNYKISYLAEETGFSSHSSFTTVFKSVTGISPTKFMDLLQKEGSHEK